MSIESRHGLDARAPGKAGGLARQGYHEALVAAHQDLPVRVHGSAHRKLEKRAAVPVGVVLSKDAQREQQLTGGERDGGLVALAVATPQDDADVHPTRGRWLHLDAVSLQRGASGGIGHVPDVQPHAIMRDLQRLAQFAPQSADGFNVGLGAHHQVHEERRARALEPVGRSGPGQPRPHEDKNHGHDENGAAHLYSKCQVMYFRGRTRT